MLKVIIMHQTITKHDAIGNDIEEMFLVLKTKFNCVCYAENKFNDQVSYVGEEEAINIIENRDNLVIYHHSVYWKNCEELLNNCKAKLIIRYHNITPPIFFKKYNDYHYEQCKKGREQTLNLMKKHMEALWMSASLYNTEDLLEVPKQRIAICSPFGKLEKWSRKTPDEQLLKDLIYSNTLNLLFVGRVVPNKGHLYLLEVIYLYCYNFDSKIKLRIVGKFDDGLVDYNQEIKNKIEQYGISSNVEFIGEITDSTLLSYYLGSDLFVCSSEHEGFCLPIIEAQYFKLPIVSLNRTAISETIGSDQLLLQESPLKFAAALHTLKENIEYCKFLRDKGYENYINRFSYNKCLLKFKSILMDKMEIEL